MRPSVRRAAALLAAPALAVATLAALSAPASAAIDPAPVAAGADWLSSQLTDGVIYNDQYDFDDIGLTIDAALATAATGQGPALSEISAGVAPHVATDDGTGYAQAQEYDYAQDPPAPTQIGHYAGASAKALRLVEVADQDPHTYGGIDLLANLEDLVATDAPITGRIEDDSDYGDFANVIGQIFAAETLTNAGSDAADSVESFLLEQQCADGYFRLSFTTSKTATDQTCDGGTAAQSAPDTDVTALFVITMQQFAGDPEIASALGNAQDWLEGQQHADGSFGGGPSTEAANANSTGLAGWALALRGNEDAAAKAAAWVRAHQITNVGACTPYDSADLGAIAYDNAARNALRGSKIDETTEDQFRRATSQALPVLQWAPSASGTESVSAPTGYLKGGSTVTVGVTGAAPGAAVCATVTGGNEVLGWAGSTGKASLRLALPARTGAKTIRVAGPDGSLGNATVHILGAKRLPVTLKKTVRKGHQQKVVVKGLAVREPVQVRIGAKHKAGKARPNGTFVATFTMRKVGKAKAVVYGAFANRKAVKTFRVVR